ncbi:helix-turn-helix domain-containing protein [Saccharothrix sp. AJ9571]|nr:helix-turn-helix domain-containing protein [Saccharothrix sp. AJ9571]
MNSLPLDPLPGDTFARRVRQERERQNISQAELARRMARLLDTNVDSSAVTRIEQQTRTVRLDEAVAVAKALGVPLMFLLSDDPASENDADLEHYRAELALAQSEWERTRLEIQRLSSEWERNRLEVQRLTKIIEVLAGGADPQLPLDPRSGDALDIQVPADSDGIEGEGAQAGAHGAGAGGPA